MKLQALYGEKLSVIELPGVTSSESEAIHCSLLTLKEIAEHDFAVLSEMIFNTDHLGHLTNEHVLQEIYRRLPRKAFEEGKRLFGPEVEQRVRLSKKIQDAVAQQWRSAELPQVVIGSQVVGGVFSANYYTGIVEENLSCTIAEIEADPLSSVSPQPPTIHLANSTIELGTVVPGSIVPIKINVTNTGEEPLELTWVELEKDCRVVRIPTSGIPKGESGEVRLSLAVPEHEYGAIARTAVIHSNATGGVLINVVGVVQ